MSIRLATFLLAPLVLALSACPSKSDPLACMDACSHQQERSFCDIDGVYPGTELKNECIAPPSPDACNRVESCTLEGKPYCTDESMGLCVECLDGSHCVDGEVCDASSNECIVLACTPGTAGDASCAAADPTLPFCGPGDTCVACLENAQCVAADSAVCDPSDFECRGCVANAECDSKVCATDSGICADEAGVVYVAKSGTDGASCGTLASPCLTIGGAEGGLAKVTVSRDTVVVGAGSYDERLDITSGAVRIVGNGDVTIDPQVVSTNPAVKVSGTAAVTIEGVTISHGNGAADSEAVFCQSNTASLSIVNAAVQNAEDIGVQADSCTLTITGSKISGNSGGGILVNGSDYSIVNNFIVGNIATGLVSGFRAEATTGKSERLEFNTFARNQRGGTAGFAVACELSNLSAANNIFMLAEASVAGLVTGDCTHAYSLFDANDATAPTGDNNISAEAVFVDPDNGEFHLQAGSPGIDAADPAATLDTDIDGDIRPQGAARDMGADEAG